MKFSSPIHFSKLGIYLKFFGRSVFLFWSRPVSWPFVKRSPETIPYKNSSKLQGASYLEMISEWVSFKYPKNHIIVLTDINVQAKNVQFWAKVPKTDMIHFVKDMVILYCQDKSEVIRLVENIPSTFAEAHGYSAGELITHNKEL